MQINAEQLLMKLEPMPQFRRSQLTRMNEWLPDPAQGRQEPAGGGQGGARVSAKKTVTRKGKKMSRCQKFCLFNLQTMRKNRTNNPVHEAV